ncbi:hypothetical protein AciM339_0668 [Aciduliprofundum sp. MAR08-339]|uniref:DUF5611 family protein n=1 Tax=Aciduliprofundum sp. (strain MAR08-339) TaxID=673860 RepID=UPI0002A4C332|nr:hypothetical protein AciM339_0668 [Aciduliprofundum sp. MAR08-339]
MRLYPFKRGHKKGIDEIEVIMKEIFGDVSRENGHLLASYGALEKIEIWIEEGKMAAETKSRKVESSISQETLKRWNDFLFRVTGYTAKERKKRMTKT